MTQFKCPSSIMIAGPSQCGKTTFTKLLLMQANSLFERPIRKIVYCYGQWQDCFKDMTDQVQFVESIPEDIPSLFPPTCRPGIPVLEDLMRHCSEDEQLMQSVKTEHRLNAPPQLPTLTRLDQDIRNIIESKLPEDQKIILLEQLIQRYQGLTKQMKSETKVAPPVVLLPPTELVPATPSPSITVERTASTSKIPRPVARSELKRKQDKPVQEETPLFSGKPVFLETP